MFGCCHPIIRTDRLSAARQHLLPGQHYQWWGPSAKLSEQCSVEVDIRVLVTEALRQGREKQPELAANVNEDAIYNFSIGFEGMGHWETEAEIWGLSLTGQRNSAAHSQDKATILDRGGRATVKGKQ